MVRMRGFYSALLLLGIAVPASADWDIGDPYKMHYPQLPELYQGIDINASYPKVLADDWQCTQTGPVSDVHFWGSWDFDNKYNQAYIHVSVHDNLPPDAILPYSRPGPLLWQRDFLPGEYVQRLWSEPDNPPPYPQYFWDPKEPFEPTINHHQIWQYNITDILEPFRQNVGQIYWLDIYFFAGYGPLGEPIPLPDPYRFGWKTSRSPHFMDDAVWMHLSDTDPRWRPLEDPRVPFPYSLDLAFVITPEPASIGLLTLGLLTAALRRSRRQR